MNDMDNARFNYLLDRYLCDQATEQERLELMLFIDSDQFPDDLEKGMKQYYGKDRLTFEDEPGELKQILSRAKAGEKEVPLFKTQPQSFVRRRWLAAAAILAFAIVMTYTYVETRNTDTSLAAKEDREFWFTGKKHVVLPDGSTVTMNENSKLVYRQSYGEKLREVYLEGEAYFKVKPDKLHAFVVRTGDVQTYVLGTEFNVNAADKAAVVVTVSSGRVQVLDQQHEVGVITPGEQLTVNIHTHAVEKAAVKAEEFTAWKQDFLIMYDVTLEEAARLIEQKFDVEITLDEGLKKCPVRSAFMNDESLTEVLAILTEVTGTTCKTKDKHITLTGKGCN